MNKFVVVGGHGVLSFSLIVYLSGKPSEVHFHRVFEVRQAMQRTTQAITVSAMGLVLVATLMGCASSGSTNTPSVKPLSSAAPAPATVAGPTFNTVNSDGKKITTAIAWSALGTGTPACNTFAKKYPKYAVQFVDITATVTYPIEDAAAGSAPYSIQSPGLGLLRNAVKELYKPVEIGAVFHQRCQRHPPHDGNDQSNGTRGDLREQRRRWHRRGRKTAHLETRHEDDLHGKDNSHLRERKDDKIPEWRLQSGAGEDRQH